MHTSDQSRQSADGRHRLPLPDAIVPGKIIWPYAISIALIHALALLALLPYLFTWSGLIVMLVGVQVFGQSINLCYHRLLSHRSARVPKWLERTFVVVALCCLQDTPAKWVATHRYHHNHSDEQEDPHSPLVAFLWAHAGWLIVHNGRAQCLEAYHKFAPDILRDRFYFALERSPWTGVWVYLAHALLFFAVGFGIGRLTGDASHALRFGLSLLVWGAIVRTVVVWHITWSVNSVTHLFGYTNHETNDHSRNNWLVALFAAGEGWHNNHHADPASASNRHRWWEFDLTYAVIKTLEALGLATDVVPPRHRRRAASVPTPPR